jgi:cytidine deaminase
MQAASKEISLLAEAEKAARNAYAPYSRLRVGAAVVTRAKKQYTGCNVENVSYGLTICAERNAIFSAVAHEGPDLEIVSLAVALDDGRPISPCGACRQVLAEFGRDATVIFRTPRGVRQIQTLRLLPHTFRLPIRPTGG